MAKNKTETETENKTEGEKPKRVVKRLPLYVLVPTGYKDVIAEEPDEDGNAVSVRVPSGHRLLGKVDTKTQVGKLLEDSGFDPTNGIEDVIVLRGKTLPIKVSTQVVVRF